VGLFLLRGFVSFTLLAHTVAYIATSKVDALSCVVFGVSLISAVGLLVGFMTPVIAIAVTVGATVLAFSGPYSSLVLIVVSVAVALLGPGAFSLDARMFGRREILLPHTTRLPKS
jgi:uncharacterized membrane protein YphA (DoxX/SURF4 family)